MHLDYLTNNFVYNIHKSLLLCLEIFCLVLSTPVLAPASAVTAPSPAGLLLRDGTQSEGHGSLSGLFL